MLKTIIRNLISNAMKFSFEGGTITLSSRSEGDFVTVSVKDTGKGIKKEDQDKLLKQDSHFTTYGTKNEKGSGLGCFARTSWSFMEESFGSSPRARAKERPSCSR